jgi:hypothetical protein
MSYTIVCVDIRCSKQSIDVDPLYRVFLDDHLVVERRFWPTTPDYYIQEQLTMLDDNCTHSIQIKNVFEDRGEIYVHDVTFVDGDTRAVLSVDCTYQDSVYYFKITKR